MTVKPKYQEPITLRVGDGFNFQISGKDEDGKWQIVTVVFNNGSYWGMNKDQKYQDDNFYYMDDSKKVLGNIFEPPCNPDHNGECLVCDCWLSDCPVKNI